MHLEVDPAKDLEPRATGRHESTREIADLQLLMHRHDHVVALDATS